MDLIWWNGLRQRESECIVGRKWGRDLLCAERILNRRKFIENVEMESHPSLAMPRKPVRCQGASPLHCFPYCSLLRNQ